MVSRGWERDHAYAGTPAPVHRTCFATSRLHANHIHIVRLTTPRPSLRVPADWLSNPLGQSLSEAFLEQVGAPCPCIRREHCSCCRPRRLMLIRLLNKHDAAAAADAQRHSPAEVSNPFLQLRWFLLDPESLAVRAHHNDPLPPCFPDRPPLPPSSPLLAARRPRRSSAHISPPSLHEWPLLRPRAPCLRPCRPQCWFLQLP